MKTSFCVIAASVCLALLFGVSAVFSNNIQVATPVLTGQNTGSHYTLVQFNLTWDNSWRDVVNWDAAWVFVKFKGNDGIWKHATLSATGSDHTAPSGSTITPSSDGKGIFIYRSTNGTGSNNFQGIKLHWNYGTDGVGDNDLITVKVFAIEMAYVPQASFSAGDGSSNAYYQFGQGNTTTPFQITSESALTLGGTSASNLGDRNSGNDDFGDAQTQTLPAQFPKGYQAFYCMKYEASQGQIADFLNTLTATQASNLYPNYSTYRYTITASGGTYTASRPDRACGYISWPTLLSYADWAGLRPMTELEYEKACRGDQSPVADEYAWGSTSITPDTLISGTENGTETAASSGANCTYYQMAGFGISGGDGGQGPLRCGIFATSTSTREQAGATYYGILDMTGNVAELVIEVGTSAGRAFQGTHGDGVLAADGSANVGTWPDYYSAFFKGGNYWWGGGSWGNLLPVSSRRGITTSRPSAQQSYTGIRCVRTAP